MDELDFAEVLTLLQILAELAKHVGYNEIRSAAAKRLQEIEEGLKPPEPEVVDPTIEPEEPVSESVDPLIESHAARRV